MQFVEKSPSRQGSFPFVVVAVVGLLTLALPPYASPGGAQVAAAGVGVAVTAFLAWITVRTPRSHPLFSVPPLLFFVLVVVTGYFGGGPAAGVTPLVVLPVLWLVLYGGPRALQACAVLAAIVLPVTATLVGPPLYGLGDLRRALVWFLIIALICPVLQKAVIALRTAVSEQERLAGELVAVLRAATGHAIIATDLQQRITLFSEGAEQMLGSRSTEVLGRPIRHLFGGVPTGPLPRLLGPSGEQELDELVPEGSSITESASFRLKDGRHLPVRMTVTRLLDAHGRQTGWMHVATDVTAEVVAHQKLVAAADRWRNLIDVLPDTSVSVVGQDLRYRVALGAETRHAAVDVVGRTLFQTSTPEDVDVLEGLYRAALQGQRGTVELTGTCTGTILVVHAIPLASPSDDPEALVVTYDVTAQRRNEADVRRALGRFARLFHEAPHGMLRVDAHGDVTQANPALGTLLGRSADDLVGVALLDLTWVEDDLLLQWHQLLAGDNLHRLTVERPLRLLDGTARQASITAVVLHAVHGEPQSLLVTFVDISERKRYEQRLADLANRDPLTGLANRRMFDAELGAHLERCRRYGARGALMLLDLDDFKQVNDTLGHGVGDQLLVAVAGCLTARVRASDIVARLGGDEFAVLLPQEDRAGAEVVAQDVNELIRGEVRLLDDGRSRKITASIGVVAIEDTDSTPSELVSTADMTMYDAKDAGRDRYVVHDNSLDAVPRTAARMAWLDRITRAVEEDRFAVHAQPVLDLAQHHVTGAELLIRMLDDDGAPLAPGRWLRIAERTDLIREIDLRMVTHAVQLLEQVQVINPDFLIEVNVSGRSVGSPQLVEHITSLVGEHAVDPHGLVLEITETAAVADIATARAFAEEIRALGGRFALDDFGAGFGSFYYLKHLLFDYIKIDGEFVVGCANNPTDRLILSSIVEIARGMGKQTIAEYVEDEEVLDLVRELGVDFAQGFHVGRPEPVQDLIHRVRLAAPTPP